MVVQLGPPMEVVWNGGMEHNLACQPKGISVVVGGGAVVGLWVGGVSATGECQ